MSSEKKVKKERIAAAHVGSRSFPVKSNSDEKKPASAKCSSTHITVKVKDQDEHEVNFRIKRDTKLKKLMDAYCARTRQGVDSLVFMLDEMCLKGNATPDELKMEENIQIDVFGHMTGG